MRLPISDWLIVTDILSRIVSELLQLIVQILDTAFLSPPLGGLGKTYDVYLGLIGKRVVDFLLVLINFFGRCYGWGATSEYRFKIGDFAPTGAGWPKILGTRSRPTNCSSSQKTRLNSISYGVKIWTDLYSVLSLCTSLTDRHTDGRTDGHTEFSSLDRVCISCSAVKTVTSSCCLIEWLIDWFSLSVIVPLRVEWDRDTYKPPDRQNDTDH